MRPIDGSLPQIASDPAIDSLRGVLFGSHVPWNGHDWLFVSTEVLAYRGLVLAVNSQEVDENSRYTGPDWNKTAENRNKFGEKSRKTGTNSEKTAWRAGGKKPAGPSSMSRTRMNWLKMSTRWFSDLSFGRILSRSTIFLRAVETI